MVERHEGSTMPIPPDRTREQLGPYRLLESIGVGGMGEVWVAEQERPIRRRVAIKLIKLGMDTREILARFESERQALALMDHVNIAQIFDAGESGGRPYFAMEYVQGVPLLEHCDRHRLTVRERIELFLQVCDGVQHAHQKAIIHRDLKPSNVLVTVQDGRAIPKIIDFGVAKALSQRLSDLTVYTELGQAIGTPAYMSPEQAELTGQNIDTRSDVYSLGIMLYELLVGVRPFDAPGGPPISREELWRQIREKEPTRPSARVGTLGDGARECAEYRRTDLRSLQRTLSGDLDWIAIKCLEKDRTRRYGSPNELADDLRRHLYNEPVVARPPSAAYRAGKFVRRHRTGVAIAVAAVFMLTAFAITMTIQAGRIAQERDRANLEAATATEVSDYLLELFELADPGEAGGDKVTVREILDEGADRIEWELEGQPALRARLMNIMGQAYISLGLYDPARPLLEEALRTQREVSGAQGPEMADILHSLGILEMLTGNTDAADSLYRIALQIRETELGPEDLDVAETLNRWGELERVRADWKKAESLYQRVLEIQVAQIGEESEQVAATFNNLSVLYWHLGRLDEAEQAMRRSLDIRERVLPPDHPNTAENLNNLGALSYTREKYDEAESFYLRALEIRERVYGPSHTEVAQTLYNVSALYIKQEKYAEAREVLDRTLQIYRSAFGNEHYLVAHCLHGIGIAYKKEGRLEEAERYLLDSIAMRERTLGPDHPRLGHSLYELADLYIDRGKLGLAERHLNRAIELIERSYGTEHTHYTGAMKVKDKLTAARQVERPVGSGGRGR